MSIVEPSDGARNIVDRVKNILLKPSTTWGVIDVEPATISGIYKGYVAPLAAIPAICGLIGGVVFGVGAFGVTVRTPLVAGIIGAIVQYLITLGMVYVLALIIDALAPNFGGVKNKTQAFKVAAYSYTAAWVAGVFSLLPVLAIIGAVLSLYSLYLLYLGLPKLMKTPEEKALPYVVVLIVIAVVITLVIGAITGAVAGLGIFGGRSLVDNSHVTGTVNIPGGASVDLSKLEAASKRMEAASQGGDGAVTPADPEVLKGLLPAAVQGFGRTGLSSASGGAGGMTGSTVEGVYAKGESKLTLTITDLGAAGALAGIAGAFNVKSSSESNGRYEKVGKVDGRMTTETYDKTNGHGEYGVLVGDRFMVQAEGDGVAIDDLKQAVAAVGAARLEQLAKAG